MNERNVLWTAPAQCDMRRLEHQTQQRVEEAVQRFAVTGHGDVKKLKGRASVYRLRVGDFRVIFKYENGQLTILVLRVLDRKDAY